MQLEVSMTIMDMSPEAKMRSNSLASVREQPTQPRTRLMMTEKNLFIRSPIDWNMTIAMGMPPMAYTIVAALPK